MSFLGDKVRELRKQHGLSQEDVAAALGVSRQAVTKWERGSSLPSSGNMLRLAELFQIPVTELTSSSGQAPAGIDAAAIENLIRRTEENEKKKQRIWRRTVDSAKSAAGVLLAYGAMYFLCWFLCVQIVLPLFPWYYINKYHFMLIVGAVSLLAAIFQKKRFARIMLAGTALAVVLGQAIGAYSAERSPLGFNESWIGLVLLWNVSLIAGIAAELIQRKRTLGYWIGKTPKTRSLSAILLLFVFLSTAITAGKSYQKMMFNHGAEQGYCFGFTQGEYDAENDLPKDAAVGKADIPPAYLLGTAKYSGFAQYWSYGYEEGYESVDGR